MKPFLKEDSEGQTGDDWKVRGPGGKEKKIGLRCVGLLNRHYLGILLARGIRRLELPIRRLALVYVGDEVVVLVPCSLLGLGSNGCLGRGRKRLELMGGVGILGAVGILLFVVVAPLFVDRAKIEDTQCIRYPTSR